MNGDVGVLIRRQFDEIVIESTAHDLRGRFLWLGIERRRNLVRGLKFLDDDLFVLIRTERRFDRESCERSKRTSLKIFRLFGATFGAHFVREPAMTIGLETWNIRIGLSDAENETHLLTTRTGASVTTVTTFTVVNALAVVGALSLTVMQSTAMVLKSAKSVCSCMMRSTSFFE